MRLAPPFTDHAVLQRDRPIPVWGVAAPDQVVTVTLAGRSARVIAAANGSWLVRLAPLPAGGPHELVARCGESEARIGDVLIGEVWICSGQSNMQWKLTQTPHGLSPADCDLPRLRLLTVDTEARLGRQDAVKASWQVSNLATLCSFSAVGAWFGRIIHARLGVPVGMICNAWGGTRVQAWMSREALMRDPGGLDEVRAYEAHAYTVSPPGTVLTMADWELQQRKRDAVNQGLADGWAATAFDDAAWKTIELPGSWQNAGGHPGSGVFWFRRRVAVPAAWKGRELELRIGAVDKHDDSYVNGERVGGLTWEDGGDTWCRPRVYRLPARLVAGSELSIAVRARSHAFHGGLIGPDHEMRVFPVGQPNEAVRLTGAWRYAIEQDWGVQTPPAAQMEPGNPNCPYTLFDSRLAPLIPYGLRGAIWYQGESNAGEPAVHRRLLPQMISDWRRAFGQGDFPFLQVQLANYMAVSEQPKQSNWAELRDTQAATALEDPQGGFAVAIDVGDAKDIHPTDKKSVGERLARWALAESYGLGGAPCGPLFAGMTIEAEGRVRVRFRHAHGLKTKDGKAPSHVAIAGIDRVFAWAQTRIEGETLVAWHPHIPKPSAVRYAWADNPEGCNLVAGDGAPTAPFRSDCW